MNCAEGVFVQHRILRGGGEVLFGLRNEEFVNFKRDISRRGM
jgi:hypothetical protein